MSAVAAPVATRTEPVRVRRLTPTLFAAAALAFLLPFGTVSCNEEVVNVTGVELATYTVDGADAPGSLAADVEAHGLFALAALAAALAGAAVASRRDRGGGWAIAGLCSLFLLAFNSDTMVLGPDIDYGVGYVLAFAGLALAGLARFCIRVEARLRNGEKVWTWWLALAVGTPATPVVLLFADASFTA